MKSFFILLKILKNFVEIQNLKKKRKMKKKNIYFCRHTYRYITNLNENSGLKNGYIVKLFLLLYFDLVVYLYYFKIVRAKAQRSKIIQWALGPIREDQPCPRKRRGCQKGSQPSSHGPEDV